MCDYLNSLHYRIWGGSLHRPLLRCVPGLYHQYRVKWPFQRYFQLVKLSLQRKGRMSTRGGSEDKKLLFNNQSLVYGPQWTTGQNISIKNQNRKNWSFLKLKLRIQLREDCPPKCSWWPLRMVSNKPDVVLVSAEIHSPQSILLEWQK